MDYEIYYENHKEELIQMIKDSGYSFSDIKEASKNMSMKQFIVELFS